ncbi:IS3 family transposase [Curtobacterium sp. PhB130]|uniref:IS3 family transposase n=1 Tax=Curtobacterium sp. PhB130 TaxID=2485178 RepID=UPI001405159C
MCSVFQSRGDPLPRPWRGIEDLDTATVEYLDWFNHRRLRGELGMVSPVEFEQIPHRRNRSDYRRSGTTEPPLNPGAEHLFPRLGNARAAGSAGAESTRRGGLLRSSRWAAGGVGMLPDMTRPPAWRVPQRQGVARAT